MKFNKILLVGVDETKLDPEFWKRIDNLTSKKVYVPKDSPEIRQQLEDTDCLLVNFGITVDKQDMEAAPNLKYIGALATAYGKIDVEGAKNRGIVVSNLPGYSTESVAEFTIAAILEHCRELEKGKKQAREGNYSEAGFSAVELKNKNFGIVGAGLIGVRVAELASGFGAKIKYWSKHRKGEIEKKGFVFEEVEKLVSECDFISINLAQTAETENFFNEKLIQKIKKNAVVINTAPMELMDLNALEARLSKGDFTFILDHSDEMAEESLNKLKKYPNCIIYPPIAYITKEARIAKQEMFVSNIEAFIQGKPQNTVY